MKISEIIKQIEKDHIPYKWSTEREVSSFLQYLFVMGRGKNFLEVGTYKGYTTFHILEKLPPSGRIYTVDIDDYFSKYINKVSSSLKKKVVFLRGSIKETEKKIPKDLFFNFIFIDSEHSFRQSLEDFTYCLRKSEFETIIAFHDSRGYIGVNRMLRMIEVLNWICLNQFFEVIFLPTIIFPDGGQSGLALVRIKSRSKKALAVFHYFLLLLRKCLF